MLIQVRIPSQPEAKERFETAWMNAAFASKDYNEEIVCSRTSCDNASGREGRY
jgi:hypothetical protein